MNWEFYGLVNIIAICSPNPKADDDDDDEDDGNQATRQRLGEQETK